MNLPCMNCKKEVAQDEAKLFAEVFLCPSCFTQAGHFFSRMVSELNFLLTMAKESIRLALVQGKFSFPEGPSGEPSKRAVLEEILKLEEARDKQSKERSCVPTPSSESTRLPAPSKTVVVAGSSSKDSPRG